MAKPAVARSTSASEPAPKENRTPMPDRDLFPVSRHAFRGGVLNAKLLKGKQYPEHGPAPYEPAAREVVDLRAATALEQKYVKSWESGFEAARSHFRAVVSGLFEDRERRLSVGVDGVYLVGMKGKKFHVVDLSGKGPSEVATTIKLWRDIGITETKLHLFGGYHTGDHVKDCHHTVDAKIAAKPRGGATNDLDDKRPWESFLIPEESASAKIGVKGSKTMSVLRAARESGILKEGVHPEVALTEKFDRLTEPSPRARVPIVVVSAEDAKKLSAALKTPPDAVRQKLLLAAADDHLAQLTAELQDGRGSADGLRRLYSLGRLHPETAGDAMTTDREALPTDPEFIEYWRQVLARSIETTSGYILHPTMLSAQYQASKVPDFIIPYKDVEQLTVPYLRKCVKSYAGVGPCPIGYIGSDQVEESITKALPRVWCQPIRGVTAFPLLGSSMNYLFGDLNIVEGAVNGFVTWLPGDGAMHNLSDRIELARSVVERIKHHPAIVNHPFGRKRVESGETTQQFLKRTSLERVGASVKGYPPEQAIKEVEALLKEGITLFRLYDPGATEPMIETARILKERFKDQIKLVVGQVTNVWQARELEKIKVDAIVVGIGDGGHCTTAELMGLYCRNLQIATEIGRAGLNVKLIVDGGPGPESIGTALGIGATVMVSGSLFGGTFEAPPYHYFKDKNGVWYKFSFGEASRPTKISGGEYLGTDMVWNVEGEVGRRFFAPFSPTVAYRGLDAIAKVAKVLRFMRHRSVLDALLDPCPHLVMGDDLSDKLRRSHVNPVTILRAPDVRVFSRGLWPHPMTAA